MTTIKSFTDLEQSKKLSGILPLDSADHCFLNDGTAVKAEINSYNVALQLWKDHYVEIIPAWSLAALFDIVSEIKDEKERLPFLAKTYLTHKYHCFYNDVCQTGSRVYDNPVDAVVDMIFKLNELKML